MASRFFAHEPLNTASTPNCLQRASCYLSRFIMTTNLSNKTWRKLTDKWFETNCWNIPLNDDIQTTTTTTPGCSSVPIVCWGWSSICVALTQPHTNARREFSGSGLVNSGNVSVVYTVQSCSSFCLPVEGWLGWVDLEQLCRFPAHRNYEVTQRVSTMRFEPGTASYESSTLSLSQTRHSKRQQNGRMCKKQHAKFNIA